MSGVGLDPSSGARSRPIPDADHIGIERRARTLTRRSVAPFGLVIALVLIGGVALLVRAPLPLSGSDASIGPASSCAAGDWPLTVITCDGVFRIGNQAGARVDRARIWLTTLGPVVTSMRPAQQVSALPDETEVWVIVYDGRWVCCPNAFDENGERIPQTDKARWLVAAESATEGTGFVYLQDWTGKPVPESLPSPSR